MTHLVMFSGGLASWATAKRVVERHPNDAVRLIFADTLIEDPDLYRFLREAAKSVGRELVWLKDGRTPWQVFDDVKMLGNSKADPCSRILKRELINNWREEHYTPGSCVSHIVYLWDEFHRLDRVQERHAPWRVESYMTEPPYLSKPQIIEWARAEGLEPPRLSLMGFPHNNCGGFCIKAGHAQFAAWFRAFPEKYREAERLERAWQNKHGKPHTILRDRAGGESTPLSLREFRERLERGQSYDLFDWGGCACMEEPAR